jgi:hypothetical protein
MMRVLGAMTAQKSSRQLRPVTANEYAIKNFYRD